MIYRYLSSKYKINTEENLFKNINYISVFDSRFINTLS